MKIECSRSGRFTVGILAWMVCGLNGVECQEFCVGEPPLSPAGTSLPQTCILVPQDNRTRCFYTFVPDCAEGKTPIVMDIHGVGSCGRLHGELSGWIDKAAEECIALVLPEADQKDDFGFDAECFLNDGGFLGLPASETTQPTVGCCCLINEFPPIPPFNSPVETFDIEFLLQIMDTTENTVLEISNGRVTADMDRMYLSGECIAARHSERVTAVACTGGTIITPFADTYIPTPIQLIRGELDSEIPYEGQISFGFLIFPSSPFVYEYLSELNGCETRSSTTLSVPEMNLPNRTGEMITETSMGCDNHANVELITLTTGGHQTVQAFRIAENSPETAATTTVNVVSLMWDFLKPHGIHDDSGVRKCVRRRTNKPQ